MVKRICPSCKDSSLLHRLHCFIWFWLVDIWVLSPLGCLCIFAYKILCKHDILFLGVSGLDSSSAYCLVTVWSRRSPKWLCHYTLNLQFSDPCLHNLLPGVCIKPLTEDVFPLTQHSIQAVHCLPFNRVEIFLTYKALTKPLVKLSK